MAVPQPAIADSWHFDAIRAPSDLRPKNKKKVVVAIVDDGVRISHQDFADLIWKNRREVPSNGIDDDGNGKVDDVGGWDISDDDPIVSPPAERLGEYYHGTHLAGVVARIAKRAYGKRTARRLQIMPVKVLADRAETTAIKDGYRGIEYAIHAGADIILCAWGVGHLSQDEERILRLAEAKGVLVVASAGNFPEERDQFPAASSSVIGVAALDQSNKKIARSNYGASVDLSGPGLEILGASSLSDTATKTDSGTSQSAALVAAAAALVMIQHPSYTLTMVKAALENSAVPLELQNPDYPAKLGAGLLNIKGAVSATFPGLKEKRRSRPQGYLPIVRGARKLLIRPTAQPIKGLWISAPFFKDRAKKTVIAVHVGGPDGRLVDRKTLAAFPEQIFVAGEAAFIEIEPRGVGGKLSGLLAYTAESINFGTLYCRGTVKLDKEGIIEDGSGSEDYSPKSSCKWQITAPPKKVVQFSFDELDTEIRTDMIFFFNGTTTQQDRLMAIFSGREIPPELWTWSNQVLVWFVSNETVQGKGWRGTYRFVDPPPRSEPEQGQ